MTLMLSKVARAHEQVGVPVPQATSSVGQPAAPAAAKRKDGEEDAGASEEKPPKAQKQDKPVEEGQTHEPMQ